MSIALVHDTQKEIRRLLIAGSDLAAGDFRLLKIVPKLKQSGEKAPIFTRVAQAIEKVVEPGHGKVSGNLLELANIVNAILYTQGETGIAGEMRDIDTVEVSCATNAAYRKISPVIEALTTKGAGRHEVIVNAMETKIYSDLRLINPLILALGDGYNEIANTALEILKDYGTVIIPVLKRKLDLSGGKADARILELLAVLLGVSGKELYLAALEQGSLVVQISAIYALKDIPECENIILDLVDHKKKEIREAAIDALAVLTSDAAATRLFKAFTSKDREMAIEPVKRNNTKLLTTLLLGEAEKTLSVILQSESKGETAPGKEKDDPRQKAVDDLFVILECLTVKREPEVVAFFKKCLEHTQYLAKIKDDLRFYDYQQKYGNDRTLARAAAHGMLVAGTEEVLEFLIKQEGMNNNHLLGLSFEAALTSRSPEYVFECYSKYVIDKKKKSLYQDILHVMKHFFIREAYDDAEMTGENHAKITLHNDWIKVLVANEETELLCAVIPEGSSKAIEYLHSCLKKTKEADYYNNKIIIQALLQAKDKKIHEVMENKLRSILDVTTTRIYHIQSFVQLAKSSGPGIIKVLEKLAVGRSEEIQDILLVAAKELKNEEKEVNV